MMCTCLRKHYNGVECRNHRRNILMKMDKALYNYVLTTLQFSNPENIEHEKTLCNCKKEPYNCVLYTGAASNTNFACDFLPKNYSCTNLLI